MACSVLTFTHIDLMIENILRAPLSRHAGLTFRVRSLLSLLFEAQLMLSVVVVVAVVVVAVVVVVVVGASVGTRTTVGTDGTESTA